MPGPCINIQEGVGFGDVLAWGGGKIFFLGAKGVTFVRYMYFGSLQMRCSHYPVPQLYYFLSI